FANLFRVDLFTTAGHDMIRRNAKMPGGFVKGVKERSYGHFTLKTTPQLRSMFFTSPGIHSFQCSQCTQSTDATIQFRGSGTANTTAIACNTHTDDTAFSPAIFPRVPAHLLLTPIMPDTQCSRYQGVGHHTLMQQ